MKKEINKISLVATLSLLFMMFFNASAFSQDNVKAEVNGQDVGAWFGNNWLWISGVIVLLLILLIASTGSRSKRITSVKRDDGKTVRTTTTINESD